MKGKMQMLLGRAARIALIVGLLAACTPRSGDEPLAGSDPIATPTQSPQDAVNSDDATATPQPDEDVTLTDEDRAQLVRLTLERALIDQEIPDIGLMADRTSVVLSTENIKPEFVPELPGMTLALLSPEEIQTRADAEGDFLYLRFDEISTTSENEARVALSNTWAIGADSDAAYLSGGGFTIKYEREDGEWTGEVTEMWIS